MIYEAYGLAATTLDVGNIIWFIFFSLSKSPLTENFMSRLVESFNLPWRWSEGQTTFSGRFQAATFSRSVQLLCGLPDVSHSVNPRASHCCLPPN